jgi:hypothetical protein
MTAALMSLPHTTPLLRGSAHRLLAAPHARWVAVLQGEVWLTTDGHDDTPGEDVWLAAGESWLLPAGASVVLQGEPAAQVQVLEAAPRLVSAAQRGGRVSSLRPWLARLGGWGRAAAQRLGWLRPQRPAGAPCAAC